MVAPYISVIVFVLVQLGERCKRSAINFQLK